MPLEGSEDLSCVMGFIDMREQINGLAQIAEAKKPIELLSRNYFVFLGKTWRVMKMLYLDTTGFCVWIKRLEKAPSVAKEDQRRHAYRLGELSASFNGN